MSSTEQRVADALNEVRRVLEEVVRAEQQMDQLTGLPNDFALNNDLEVVIERGEAFWCAFVEVDHFKRLNDKFTQELADGMLKRIASHLATAASDFFGQGTRAYRAHGDEFFLVCVAGQKATNTPPVGEGLDQLRENISRVRILVEKSAEAMACTVSVGWVESAVLVAAGDKLTPRSVRAALEVAVSHAKRNGRNCVLVYDATLQKTPPVSIRDNCSECRSAFTFDVARAAYETAPMFCPNCGHRIERPEVTAKPIIPAPRFA